MKNVISLVDSEQPLIIEYDRWQLLAELPDDFDKHYAEPLIYPLEAWLSSQRHEQGETSQPRAFWLNNETDVARVEPWLEELELLALNFPVFVDGRAYSQAVELRTRLQWKKELRAIGDVLRDQLGHMHRCGFNSFAVRQDKDVFDAIKGLTSISQIYAGSVLDPEPLFRRRMTQQLTKLTIQR